MDIVHSLVCGIMKNVSPEGLKKRNKHMSPFLQVSTRSLALPPQRREAQGDRQLKKSNEHAYALQRGRSIHSFSVKIETLRDEKNLDRKFCKRDRDEANNFYSARIRAGRVDHLA
jgi:hypothetical protein